MSADRKSPDRWRTGNAFWQHSAAEFKAEYFPDSPIPFGRAEKCVYTALFFAARPRKRNGKKIRITRRISQSRLAVLSELKSEYYLRKVLKNLYALGLVKMVVKGEKYSKGSRYLVWHLPKIRGNKRATQ